MSKHYTITYLLVVPPVRVAIEENRYSVVEGGGVVVCVTAENEGDEKVEVIVTVHVEGESPIPKYIVFLIIRIIPYTADKPTVN